MPHPLSFSPSALTFKPFILSYMSWTVIEAAVANHFMVKKCHIPPIVSLYKHITIPLHMDLLIWVESAFDQG